MAGFDLLTPEAVLQAAAGAHDRRFEGSLTPYPSYINRVYGLRDEEGHEYVVKFYRPDRWSYEAVIEEHQFIFDCSRAEIPVIPPIPDADGETLSEISAEADSGSEQDFLFALFPKRGGRTFDAEGEQEWLRLGRLLGRLHLTGRERKAEHRLVFHPDTTTLPQVKQLAEMVHPDLKDEFSDITGELLHRITPLFSGVSMQRIHGDCHRGNILDRAEEGLLLIDFDDMVHGPPVHDLWLLLPGRRDECRREIALLAEGYEDFTPFPWEILDLIEPLRSMRMIHFMAWCGAQRDDRGFRRHFPDWGSRAYWTTELEDLRDQLRYISE